MMIPITFVRRYFYYTVILLFTYTNVFAQADTVQKVVPGRVNASHQQNKPYLILISVDGLRHDYVEKYDLPFLKSVKQQGVSTPYMRPSFPTLTFPNHYTMVTGLYPAHHGLVSNYFYDRKRRQVYTYRKADIVADEYWYGGVPLWSLAEQQQMVTASFFWVGSEAAIRGRRPTYYYRYNESITIDRRIDVLRNWLLLPTEKRPHLITFYFPEVDHAGHDYGPDAPETIKVLKQVDSSIRKIVTAVSTTGLDVNYILVSDHGMTAANQDQPVIPPVLDSGKFVMGVESELIQIYGKEGADIQSTYQQLKKDAINYKVYLRDEVPARLRFNAAEDCFNRIGDIILIADWPYVFSSAGRRIRPGKHGYDPFLVPDMGATFIAWGPAFRKKKQVAPFDNVHLYPVVTQLLGLEYNHPIDGTSKLAKKILKKK